MIFAEQKLVQVLTMLDPSLLLVYWPNEDLCCTKDLGYIYY